MITNNDRITKQGQSNKRGNAKITYVDGYRSQWTLDRRNGFHHEWNDCTVRAIANSFEVSYATAHGWCKEHMKRKDKCGTYSHCIHRFMMDTELLASLGYKVTDMRWEREEKWYDNAYLRTQDGSKAHKSEHYRLVQTMKQTKWWNDNRRETGTMPLLRFALRNPKGNFFMNVKGHSVAMVDQVVYDNGDRTTGRHKVLDCYKVEKL